MRTPNAHDRSRGDAPPEQEAARGPPPRACLDESAPNPDGPRGSIASHNAGRGSRCRTAFSCPPASEHACACAGPPSTEGWLGALLESLSIDDGRESSPSPMTSCPGMVLPAPSSRLLTRRRCTSKPGTDTTAELRRRPGGLVEGAHSRTETNGMQLSYLACGTGRTHRSPSGSHTIGSSFRRCAATRWPSCRAERAAYACTPALFRCSRHAGWMIPRQRVRVRSRFKKTKSGILHCLFLLPVKPGPYFVLGAARGSTYPGKSS
jgi:hypothetical protein